VVNNSTAKKTVTLSVTNEFGEIFTKNCTLNFDFRETPILENFSISISDGNTVVPLSKF
jgi:ABC-type bacteriocin/lantibiotic exporter with double-glycine peptidase domain